MFLLYAKKYCNIIRILVILATPIFYWFVLDKILLVPALCSLLIGARGAHSIGRDIHQIIYYAWHNDVMLDMLAIKF